MSLRSQKGARRAVSVLSLAGLTLAVPLDLARAAPPATEPASDVEAAGPGEAAGPSEADRAGARQLAQDGRALFFKEEYEASIKAFLSAYGLVADPNLLFNVSAAYEKLGRYDDAIDYLDRYAKEAPPGEQAGIEAKRAELEAAREAAASAAPAETPEPTPDPGAGPGVDPSPGPEGPDPIRGPDPTPDGPERPPIMGPLGWSLAGVALVGLGVGVGTGTAALGASRAGEDACVEVGGQLRCPASAEADLDRGRALALTADVAFGVAAVATVATLVVVGVRVSKRRRTDAADRQARFTGLGATVRF